MQQGAARLAVAASIVVTLSLGAVVVVTVSRDVEPGPHAAAVTEPAEAPGVGDDDSCVPASLEERAAKVLVVGLPGVTVSSDPIAAEALDAGVGGVLITEPNVESSAQLPQLVSDLRARAQGALAVVTGEESGRVSTFRKLLGPSPSARSYAATRTPEQVRAVAAELGRNLAALGIDVDLAPVADLGAGPATGVIGDRSFSADPGTAAAYAVAWAQGLASQGIRPTAKHFPGHGRVTEDSHLELVTVDATLDELLATDLLPFAALIDAGVPLVMLEHVAYTAFDPDLPASLAPGAYRLLRDMGFEGVAITDSVGMGAVNLRWSFPEAAVMAVTAGADAVLTTDGTQARAMRDALVDAVRSGRLDEDRLDEAAGRMAALAGDDTEAVVCRSLTLPDMTPASG